MARAASNIPNIRVTTSMKVGEKYLLKYVVAEKNKYVVSMVAHIMTANSKMLNIPVWVCESKIMLAIDQGPEIRGTARGKTEGSLWFARASFP